MSENGNILSLERIASVSSVIQGSDNLKCYRRAALHTVCSRLPSLDARLPAELQICLRKPWWRKACQKSIFLITALSKESFTIASTSVDMFFTCSTMFFRG